MPSKVPDGLGEGGRVLWREVMAAHELDEVQRVQLLEACRMKDRLDRFDALLRGDLSTWASLQDDYDGSAAVLVINGAVDKANTTANIMKQLLAALRLPDAASGKRPQQRGGARGAYEARTPGGKSADTAASRAKSRWGA